MSDVTRDQIAEAAMDVRSLIRQELSPHDHEQLDAYTHERQRRHWLVQRAQDRLHILIDRYLAENAL